MCYVLAAILLIVIIVLVLLFSKMSVRMTYRGENLCVRFRLLFLRYTYDSSRPKKEKKKTAEQEKKKPEQAGESVPQEKADEKKSIGYWIDKIKEYYGLFCDVTTVAAKVLSALRYKLQVREVKIDVTYGTGDAAQTGMAYGGAWAAVSQLYMLLSQYLIFEYPRMELTPVFDQKCFSLAAEGIICFRPVHIIKAAVIGLSAYYKQLSHEKKDADR